MDFRFWNAESKSSDSDTPNDLSNPQSKIGNPKSKI